MARDKPAVADMTQAQAAKEGERVFGTDGFAYYKKEWDRITESLKKKSYRPKERWKIMSGPRT